MTEPKPSPVWQGLRPTGKTLDNGLPEPGRPIIINCQQSNPENCHETTSHRPDPPERTNATPGLCHACVEEFRMVLADVPLLLDDLDIAIAGETRFVEHGTRNGTNSTTSTGGNQAIAAHKHLTEEIMKAAKWFGGTDTIGTKQVPRYSPEQIARGLAHHLDRLAHLPELRNLAMFVSGAVVRAHKIIDAPPDLTYYGACPDGHDIWQERIHRDSETPVKCRCGYTSPLVDHQKRLLNAGEDRQLTIDELVGVFEAGGIPVTRDQIKGWIRRDGLPRERRNRPRWVEGELKDNEVWCYRLGDVRDYALKAAAKRDKVSA